MAPAPTMKAVRHVRSDQEHREARQHGEAEIPCDLAQHLPQLAAAKITRADENGRPDAGGREIEKHEPAPADAADAEGERREVAHAIDEAKAQDEPDIEALEPGQRTVDALAPMWLSRQHAQAEASADPEIALVAGKTAEPGGDHEQRRIQQAFRRRERREQHERLAFEERPYEGDRIGPRAVRGDEVLNVHARCVSSGPRPKGLAIRTCSIPKVEPRFGAVAKKLPYGAASCCNATRNVGRATRGLGAS